MTDAHTLHMEKGPIGSTLIRFALPVLLAQLLQEVYNLSDCMVIGHFGGDYGLAAVSLSGLILSVLINFFVGFSSGISVITAELFGSYDYPRLRKTLTAVFRLVLLTGAGISLLGAVSAPHILRLLRSPLSVYPHAVAYLRICSAGMASLLFYNIGTAVLRSLGDTKTPLLLSVISVTLNLVLDILFVIGFGMGASGAALATMLSQWVLAALIFLRLRGMDSAFSFRLLGETLPAGEVLAILKMGLPAGFQALFMSISSLLVQVNINGFGPDAIAGMNLYAKVEGLLYLPTFSYGIALTGFIGQNCGAGAFRRIRDAVRLSLKTVSAVIFPLSILLPLLSPLILRLFTADAGIIYNAREAILFNLPFYTIYAVNQVYLGAIKGLGNTTYPMVCTLLCYSLFRVLWCRLLIPVFPTMRVVYLSYDVSFFLMLALLVPKYNGLYARLEKKAA